MCLTGRLPFSNYCVSSLAAGFRFHLYSVCIPLPRNFNIGCCANEKLLRLIAHRRVGFFTFMFVSTVVLGAGGELVESNSSFGKYCDPGGSMSVPPQCQHDTEKTVYDLRFWHDDA